MNPPVHPASQSAIVPSKNALRALRRLALSSPVLVASTLGGVCGIATLNYEVNRRVRLAEQALESKKIIRSLSHGRGASQLNAMIGAAERGEDFTLSTRSTKRKKKTPTRDFSAVALQEHSEHIHDITSENLPPEAELQYPPFIQFVPSSKATSRPSQTAPAIETDRSGMDGVAAEKHLRVGKVPHRTPTYQTSMHPKHQHKLDVDRATNLQNWLGRVPNGSAAKISAYSPPKESNNDRTTQKGQRSTSDLRIRRVAVVDYMHGQETPIQDDGNHPHTPEFPIPQNPLHTEDGSGQGRPPPGESDRKGASPSMDPLLDQTKSIPVSNHEDQQVEATIRGAFHARGDRAVYLIAYLDDEGVDQALRDLLSQIPQLPWDPVAVECLLPSAPEDFVNHAKDILDPKTLFGLHQFIQPENRKMRRHYQYRRWLAVMRHFTTRPSTLNWAMAEAVFYEHRSLFRLKDLSIQPVFDLVQYLLETDTTSSRVQNILFPDSLQQDSADPAEAFQLSIKYLNYFCEEQHTVSECLEETKKMIDIARRHGLAPSQDIIMPVLKALVRLRDSDNADIVLDQLWPMLGNVEYIDILSEYTFLNACEGNWAVVESTLDKIHGVNTSRFRPVEFARLFQRLLLQHAAQNPSAQSFGFTVHAIKYAGLIPTGLISRTLICACIRDRRYDLVVEWVRLVKEAFPRVSLGFDLLQGGWILADTLMEVGASCEEVARACLTIAHGCRKNPFSPNFREFAIELIKTDLAHRLCTASAQMSTGSVSGDDIRKMSLEQLLTLAFDLRNSSTNPQPNEMQPEGLRSDIATQMAAIVDLVKTFRGDTKLLFLSNKSQMDIVSKRRRDGDAGQKLRGMGVFKRTFPELFDQDGSTGARTLTAALVAYYDGREKKGLPVDHTVLRHLITNIGPQHPAETLELVEAIYASGYVQGHNGAPFDADIFKKWLYLVSTNGSVASAATVLKAVVYCSSQLEWTTHFRVLCEFVAQVESYPDGSFWDERQYPKKPEDGELRPLYEEIKRIWLVAAKQRKEAFRFPEWKGWEMEIM
ncbi:hypothetical protein Z517_10808 [Fonsecaea pedrosoi CBS 271.37]|uniref:Uncharacterized protein n=1 Tax=Fonsecaea pedrosoi CBS 271.37 TaxID=1442368 RepID=A0A0D2G603_9EURO|nr:uncharacterized protein Z517_10808 [Fonsecaea pedrosoi CBS 271.37]KIW76063.1 hypothetical protein Z517_10808 [Fonsecaea pedrosoi CBS 271.37]